MLEQKAKEGSMYHPIEDNDESSSCSEMDDPLLMNPYKLPRRRSLLSKLLLTIGLVAIIFIYSILLVLATSKIAKTNRLYGTRFANSALEDHIIYEPQLFHDEEWPANMTYFTKPSEEVDGNWHEIFEYQNIGFSYETMKALDRLDDAVKLPDGNYYGSLMVFHHLHCLKNIYHGLHPEYYELDNLTAEAQDSWDFHLEHCLHMIRQGIMCQADTSLITMKWGHKGPQPIGNFSSPHECVNWDRLMEWVKPHAFDGFAEGVIVHPEFGPPFINGKPAKVGSKLIWPPKNPDQNSN